MSDLDAEGPPPQTLSIPSLLLLAALSALAIRYLFFSSPSSATAHSRSTSSRSRAANPADVERVAQMFPQIPRRDIMWDLQRNGGSVEATTERILRGDLDAPPPTFQPVIPISSTSTRGSAPGTPALTMPNPNLPPEAIDLIKRYNLSNKISPLPSLAEETSTTEPEAQQESRRKDSGWSDSRAERAAMLQRRREEMILNARRKLEQRDREKEKGKGKAVA